MAWHETSITYVRLRPPREKTKMNRSKLQDAFHYAVAAAVMNGVWCGYESSIGTARHYHGENRAYFMKQAIASAKEAGYTGSLFSGLKIADRGAALAQAVLDFGKANGVDAYTSCRFCACGKVCDDECDTACHECNHPVSSDVVEAIEAMAPVAKALVECSRSNGTPKGGHCYDTYTHDFDNVGKSTLRQFPAREKENIAQTFANHRHTLKRQ